MYFVYILYSVSADKFYIGSSGDPEIRLKKHLSNHKGFTGTVKDWIICHKEPFEDKKAALQREKQLKGWKSKIRIQELIEKRSKNT